MLAPLLLVSAAASAGPRERAAALPADRGDSDGLILVIEDAGGRLSGEPAITLRAERYQQRIPLRDAGEQPDLTANDRIFTAWVNPAPQAAEMQVALLDGDETLWSDTAPLVGGSPTIRMVLTADDVLVVFDVPEPGPPPEGGPPPSQPDGPDGRSNQGESPVALALLSGAAGFALGAGLVALVVWRRLRGSGALRPIGTPPPSQLPGLPDGSVTLAVPAPTDPHRVAVALAQAAARFGPVVVVPDPAQRDRWRAAIAGKPGLTWLAIDRPMAGRVAAAARWQRGPATLLIEGPDALEEPLEGEAPDAVLAEVLDEVGSAARVLMVAPASAGLRDALPLEVRDEGLHGPTGLVCRSADIVPASRDPQET